MAILTERGRWTSSILDERGKRVYASNITEQGRKVFLVSNGAINPNPGAAVGTSSTSDTAGILIQTASGVSSGVATTSGEPIRIQMATAGSADGFSVTSDVASGVQSGVPGPANGTSTTSASPVIIKTASGNSAGSATTVDILPVHIRAANAGPANGTSTADWVIPRTGVDIKPDTFRILQ
jgi:hypothetical protein